jgi:hypothetical protein
METVMTVDDFWRLTANVNQEALARGDEVAAIAPLRKALSSLPEEMVQSYEEILSNLLYEIDGEEFAKNAGESGNSADGFLYCRCYVVSKGRAFYESVLANPAAMPKSLEEWFEPLLYVASEAWAIATGRDPDEWGYTPGVSYETGSNTSRWTTLDTPEEEETSEDDDFVEPKLERAVALAGHAFRARQYRNVVTLLAPHEQQLSKKQRRMLNEARSKQVV